MAGQQRQGWVEQGGALSLFFNLITKYWINHNKIHIYNSLKMTTAHIYFLLLTFINFLILHVFHVFTIFMVGLGELGSVELHWARCRSRA